MHESPARPISPLAIVDPGWLFLIAGILLLGATVLVPAFDELGEVQWQRDRALALERHRQERIGRYEDYRGALDRAEPSLVLALAASQLNQIPQGRTLILEPPDPVSESVTIFSDLEPPPVKLPERTRVESLLMRLATGERTRPWLIAIGGMCLLVGLLPPARQPAEPL